MSDPYPTWHRAFYADQLPPVPPSRISRALRRLRAALRRPGRNDR